jgi:hypothetical protein
MCGQRGLASARAVSASAALTKYTQVDQPGEPRPCWSCCAAGLSDDGSQVLHGLLNLRRRISMMARAFPTMLAVPPIRRKQLMLVWNQ